MKIISRAEARSQGLTRYFTGKPCKKGHISERYSGSGHCVTCMEQKAYTWRVSHPERGRENRSRYRKTNLEKVKTWDAKWRFANLERKRAMKNAWAAANPFVGKAHTAKYRAAKLQRTVSWTDFKAIKVFYENCPKGYHVDHYYPLQGKVCSGLHVLENLRYLPAIENLAKGNKMP